MKRWIWIGVISVLCCLGICVWKMKCSDNGEQEKITFEDSCWANVTNYEIEEMGDGTISVSLTAPDYHALVKMIAENGTQNELTEEILIQIAKENPDMVKEYSFIAENTEEDVVKKALIDEIAYDIIEILLESYEVEE